MCVYVYVCGLKTIGTKRYLRGLTAAMEETATGVKSV